MSIQEEYANLINSLMPDGGSMNHIGKEIADISTITQGDVDRLKKGISDGNDKWVIALILDRINKK